MGLRWWLGAFCVLVLWTAWDRDTVAEKNINAFELCELKLMEPTGLSLLANGWHKSKPGKCSEHGGKKAPCSLGFCKGCPCGTDGCGEKHGFGRGLTGKQAVQKGAEPEKVLPFRDGVPQEGMYAERAEDEFRAAPSAGCDAETLGNVLGLEFRLRQPVPESKIFNGRLVLIGLPFQWHSLTVCFVFFVGFSTNGSWSHDKAILDAHDALGRVCGLLTETDEAVTKLTLALALALALALVLVPAQALTLALALVPVLELVLVLVLALALHLLLHMERGKRHRTDWATISFTLYHHL